MLNCRFFIIANCEKIKANALDAAQNADTSIEVSAADVLVNKNTKNGYFVRISFLAPKGRPSWE